MTRKQRLIKAKALNNKIQILISWGFNIEDANFNSILIWYQGSSYTIREVHQTKEWTLEAAESFNLSEFSVN